MSGEVAFGCEISEDRKRCAIVAAGREKDGTRVVVDLVFYDHPRKAVARLTQLWEKHDPVAIVVDGRSQAGTLLKPLAEAGILVTQPSTADVAVAHGEFLDLVNDGGLAHLDQPPLGAVAQSTPTFVCTETGTVPDSSLRLCTERLVNLKGNPCACPSCCCCARWRGFWAAGR